MKMMRWFMALTGLAGIVALTGCEWSAGGSAEGITDRLNWVNFTGLYRGTNGGRIVTDYTSTAGTPGLDQFRTETVATLSPTVTVYQGVLRYKIIAEGTVTIQGPDGLQWNDDGIGGLISQSRGGINGTINYITGAWRVEVVAPVPAGKLVATYVWIGDGTQQGISRPGSGATGEILTFMVVQEGNELSFTDNNGAVFRGRFGSVRTNSGAGRDTPIDSILPASGTQVIAQFSVKGVSRAGKEVTITGTLQATVDVDADTGVVTLTERQMFGTWIEKDGKIGDVVGTASPISSQVP